MNRVLEVFTTSLKLGLTAFGGPVAHVGYFREEYVERRKWLTEERYAELLAITQFLPGPGSSQLGAAVGFTRAGWLGGLAAWVGFTLPSALFLVLFAVGIGFLADGQLLWIKGLTFAAFAVVLNAVFGMQQKLCSDGKTRLIGLLSFILLLVFMNYQVMLQPFVILLGGLLGVIFLSGDKSEQAVELEASSSSWKKRISVALILVGIVVAVPFVLKFNSDMEITGGIFKAGSLVFGGGHVVLPMLHAEVVGDEMLTKSEFLAGYGVTQAMPGPVFTLAGYLGAKLALFGNPWLGGLVGLLAVFLPGMLLLTACVPIWDKLKNKWWARAGMKGANASVVGLLAAAVATLFLFGGLSTWWEWCFVVAGFVVLKYKLFPVWGLVIAMAGAGLLMYQL